MAFSGAGAGTSGDPYQITTLAQLHEIYDQVGYYKLMNDIDASDTSSGANTQPWNGPGGWVCQDTGFSNRSLDGNGFSITNMYTNLEPRALSDPTGLISETSGEVKNLTINWIIDPGVNYSTTPIFAGIIHEMNGADVINCTVNVSIANGTTGQHIRGLGGIAAKDLGTSNTVTGCTVDLDLEGLAAGSEYIREVGGIISILKGTTITDCTTKIYIPQMYFGYKIGGVAGIFSGISGNVSISRCRAIMSIKGPELLDEVGGIVGYNIQGATNILEITECWTYGYIECGASISGFVGNGNQASVKNSWSKMDLTYIGTGDAHTGFVAGNMYGSVAYSDVQDVLLYNKLKLNNKPGNLYSADISADSIPTLPIDTYYDSNEAGDIDGGAGDNTRISGLTSANLKDSTYMSNNTGLDLTNVWTTGGYDGYLDLVNNPFDASLITVPLPVTVGAGIDYIDKDSIDIVGTVNNTTIDQVDSMRIFWGTQSGNLTNQVNLTNTDPFKARVDGLSDRDVIYYRTEVTYNSEVISSAEGEYTHYEIPQIASESITSLDYIGDVTGVHNVHGSVLVDIDPNQYLFGSPRDQGSHTDPEVNSDILKINVEDYTDKTQITITDGLGNKLDRFNQIVYESGYLWTIGEIAVSPAPDPNNGGGLVRIDPSTMDYVVFNGDQAGIDFEADAHHTNEGFLYVGYNTIYKIDLSYLTGEYASQYLNDIPVDALVDTYDHTSQGYYLDPSSPAGFNAGTKGGVHSIVSDGEFLYLTYTTGSDFDETAEETECELHKVKMSDMSPAGYARIPKATDDSTINNEYVFLGIETTFIDANDPKKNMGAEWGTVAVRKSDMEVFAIKKLHKTDKVGDTSYASIIFGNYLLDSKTNDKIYIIDISDPSQWNQIDQFAPAGTWTFTDSIGDYTLGVYDLLDDTGNNAAKGIANEIVLDRNSKFHAFGWSTSGLGSDSAPSSLTKFDITGLSFTGPAIIDTLSVLTSGATSNFEGRIISENGSAVTAVGFEYSQDPNFVTGVNTITSTVGNFVGSLDSANVGEEGTWYVRAWADNSEGRAYGDIVSFIVEKIESARGFNNRTNMSISLII